MCEFKDGSGIPAAVVEYKSNSEFFATETFAVCKVANRNITLNRHYALMNCIDNPIRLREEVFFKLESGSDPVARTDYYRGSIKIIEGKL